MRAVLIDAWATLAARPWRTLSHGLGVALGTCVFVLAIGVGQTLSAQVDERFDLAAATTVTVTATPGAQATVTNADEFVSDSGMQRAGQIGGVEALGGFLTYPDQVIAGSPSPVLTATTTTTGDVIAADPAFLKTIEATVVGHSLGPVDATLSRDVAVLGRGLAHALGISAPGGEVVINGAELHVIGIITDTTRAPQVLAAAIVSPLRSQTLFTGGRARPGVIVRTAPGAAEVVATNLARTLRPEGPDALTVTAPPNPQTLRRAVSTDVRMLAFAAGALVLTVGVFAVANLMLLAVTHRTREIGMRRAMGASGADIVGMILAEALIIGVTAGLLGTLAGLWGLLAVCISQGWTPIIDPTTLGFGIAAGSVAGILGGLIPALVAARIQPAEALRR